MTVKKYDGCRIKNKSGKEKDDVRQGETENMNKNTKKRLGRIQEDSRRIKQSGTKREGAHSKLER